tara:strand:- start:1478 stop:1870 length:393 start_codon:yes stop_codon:yes gene_type:complete
MANPTVKSKGVNREVHCATANFVFSDTVAGAYDSAVIIPPKATITGVYMYANITMAGGTNVIANIGPAGGTHVDLTPVVITADLNANNKQDSSAVVTPLALDAVQGGVISITTTGTYSAGDLDVTVCYVV